MDRLVNKKMDQKKTDYDNTKDDFVRAVYQNFQTVNDEVSERNEHIDERDGFVYGTMLERSIDVPPGHDFTPVNWLRRTVEIHKNMFMNRGFQVVSTYDSGNLDTAADEEDRKRIQIENKKAKEYAESRQNLIESIKRDNGGDALWCDLAENASAVGTSAVKTYYDEDDQKIVISPIESIENLYVLWDDSNFRDKQAVAYCNQITVSEAVENYQVPQDVPTSTMGSPLSTIGYSDNKKSLSNQKMVTVLEVTGKIPGWAIENGKCKKVEEGKETEFNAIIVGNVLFRVITDKKKIPKYYILPNKRQRRRPWGVADISDAAININVTYIETLSDWRTHAAKVNFQKYKAFNFGLDTQLPKYESRKVQVLPLGEGQDIQRLDQGDANGLDFRQQMDELKEQFVRETGISRVLFDDPSVTLNSNQALLTSMKPTSDIAEAKKQLWSPILTDLFIDALETIAAYNPEIRDAVDPEDNWTLKIMWPSVMQKEDPVYQQMLLNRYNAGTMSTQSFLEAQGETKEELDRIRDELSDPVTASILGKQLPALAQIVLNSATADVQAWFQSIMTPEQENQEGVNSNGGTASPNIQATQANNQEGQGVMSQPGSGAPPVSPGGALAQINQNAGG